MRKIKYQQPIPNNDQKILARAIIAAALISFFWIICAPNSGILQYRRVQHQVESLTEENNDLRSKNLKLVSEINRLENDEKFIEEVARKEYGFIKENEMLFNFKQSKKN